VSIPHKGEKFVLADIVVLGAGLAGTLATFELVPQLRSEDRLTLVGQGSIFQFVPSNPWLAVGWRERADVELDLSRVMQRKGVRFITEGAQRVHPGENRIELESGESVAYDYLVIATGPELAFDELPGLGPTAHTQSICQSAHAEQAHAAFEELCRAPGPVVIGAMQGASCFGPAYEFAYVLDTELRRRKLRDQVPMMFVTPEPYIGHLGLDGVGDTKTLMESEFRQRHIAGSGAKQPVIPIHSSH
jgi:sulfide:quinone oxidoreductase